MDEIRLSGSPVLEDLFRTDGLVDNDAAALDMFEKCGTMDEAIAKVNAKQNAQPKVRAKITEAALEKIHNGADDVYVSVIVEKLSKVSTWAKADLESEVREILLASK